MPSDTTDQQSGARDEDEMTEADRLELQRKAIDLRLSELASQKLKESLRASFAALQDESIPVDKIVLQVLSTKRRVTDDILHGFADCLATVIQQYQASSTEEST